MGHPPITVTFMASTTNPRITASKGAQIVFGGGAVARIANGLYGKIQNGC